MDLSIIKQLLNIVKLWLVPIVLINFLLVFVLWGIRITHLIRYDNPDSRFIHRIDIQIKKLTKPLNFFGLSFLFYLIISVILGILYPDIF